MSKKILNWNNKKINNNLKTWQIAYLEVYYNSIKGENMSENNSRKVFDSLVSRTKIYLVIILILFILISIFRPILILPSIMLYIAILCYTYFANNKRKSEISEQL